MSTSKSNKKTGTARDIGEMKVYPKSTTDEKRMLTAALSNPKGLVFPKALVPDQSKNGQTQLGEFQAQIKASALNRKMRPGKTIYRQAALVFFPHVVHTTTGTTYSQAFRDIYWSEQSKSRVSTLSKEKPKTSDKQKKSHVEGKLEDSRVSTRNKEKPKTSIKQKKNDVDDEPTREDAKEVDTEINMKDDGSVTSYDFQQALADEALEDTDDNSNRHIQMLKDFEEQQDKELRDIQELLLEQTADVTLEKKNTISNQDFMALQTAQTQILNRMEQQDTKIVTLQRDIQSKNETITNLEDKISKIDRYFPNKKERTDYFAKIQKQGRQLEEKNLEAQTQVQALTQALAESQAHTNDLERLERDMKAMEQRIVTKQQSVEKKITVYAATVFKQERGRAIAQMQAEIKGLIDAQSKAFEKKTTKLHTTHLQAIDDLMEQKQDDAFHMMDSKASELENTAMQYIDAMPAYLMEAVTESLEDMKQQAARELENHNKRIISDLRTQMKKEEQFTRLVQDIKQDVNKALAQKEVTIFEKCDEKLNEIEDRMGKYRHELGNITKIHERTLQVAATTELRGFKDDIQLASGEHVNELLSKMADFQAVTTGTDPIEEHPMSEYQETPTQPTVHKTQAAATWARTREGHANEQLSKFDKDCKMTKATTNMDKTDAHDLYQHLFEKMSTKSLPLRDFEKLEPRGSCIPSDADQLTVDLTSKILYRKILDKVSETDHEIKEILRNHSHTRNGYQVLYDIMRHFYAHLKDIPAEWGPKWEPEWSPREYVTALQEKVKDEIRAHNRTYTAQEQIIEMVLRSRAVDRYSSLTGALMIQLMLQGSKIAFQGLALSQITGLYEDKDNTHGMSTNNAITTMRASQGGAVINKFNGPRQGVGDNNRGFGSRKPKDKVQCEMCKQFGHSPEKKGQVCKEAAKIYWILQDLNMLKGSHDADTDTNLKEKLKKYSTNADLFKRTNAVFQQIKTMESQGFQRTVNAIDITPQPTLEDIDDDDTFEFCYQIAKTEAETHHKDQDFC